MGEVLQLPAVFRKRRYTVGELFSDSQVLWRRHADMQAIWAAERLDPRLREQVMLAVATVNGCGFCTYVHRELVLQTGADIVDAAELAGLDAHSLDEDHVVAVLWAQSRAQEGLGPAAEHLERVLAERFTAQQCRDLDTVVRVMTRANLVGNTFEALAHRLRGQTVRGSRLIDELVVGSIYLAGAVRQGWKTARLRGKSPLVAVREAAAAIRAAA